MRMAAAHRRPQLSRTASALRFVPRGQTRAAPIGACDDRAMLIGADPATSAATSAARSASAPTSTYSPSACAWSPTAPRPSSTGTPSAGDAGCRRSRRRRRPPSAAAARARPASSCARAKSVAEAPRSSGGTRRVRSTSSGRAGVDGPQRREARRRRARPPRACATRTSTCADASAGTVFDRRARGDEARRHRRPELGPRERRDGEQLVRELDRRVRALLRIEARVRGAPPHGRAGRARRPCAPSSARRPRSARARAQPRSPPPVSSISGRAVGEPISSSVVSRTDDAVERRRARRARRAAGRRPPSCRRRPGRSRARPRTSNGQRASVPSGQTVSR